MELYNYEVEQIVLGKLIAKNELLSEIKIKESYFYFDKHKVLYNSIFELKRHSAVDIITLSDYLLKEDKLDYIGGVSYLSSLELKHIGSHEIIYYVNILKKNAKLRELNEFFTRKLDEIKNNADPDSLIADTSDKILNFDTDEGEQGTSASEICENYSKLQEEYAENFANGEKLIGLSCGFDSLDKATDGFQPEKLWGIAAYNSVGKSTFSINMIKRLLDSGKSVCLFSLEMSKDEIFSKILALETDMSPLSITKGILNNDIYRKQAQAKLKYKDAKLVVYTECSEYEDIILTMQKEKIKNNTDVFFLDYIQNIGSRKALQQTALVSLATKELQKTIRKIKTCLVVLTQISEETNKSGKMLEVSGKDSGSLRNAANVFIYLKRDGTEEEVMEKMNAGEELPIKVILNKNRMGRIGSFLINLKLKSGIMYEPIY